MLQSSLSLVVGFLGSLKTSLRQRCGHGLFSEGRTERRSSMRDNNSSFPCVLLYFPSGRGDHDGDMARRGATEASSQRLQGAVCYRRKGLCCVRTRSGFDARVNQLCLRPRCVLRHDITLYIPGYLVSYLLVCTLQYDTSCYYCIQ